LEDQQLSLKSTKVEIGQALCIAGNRTCLYRLPQSQKKCIDFIGRTAVDVVEKKRNF
jgi:hypothetical protein